MRFWMKVCSFFFVCGLLSAVFATADQVFDLGIWHGRYPAGETNAAGESIPSSYGHFMVVAGVTTVVALLIGTFLWHRLERRYERMLVALELMKALNYENAAKDEDE